MIRCRFIRKRNAESRSLRAAIRAMWADRFTPDEIVLGLHCEVSEVIRALRGKL